MATNRQMESLAEKFAQQALIQADLDRATAMFRVARALHQESSRVNARVEQLRDGIAALESALAKSDTAILVDNPDEASEIPAPLNQGFEPLQVRYLRTMSEVELDANEVPMFDPIAEELLELERQYAALYTTARAMANPSGGQRPSDELTDACNDRVGCYCCGEGCHTCEFCRSYPDREAKLKSLTWKIAGDTDV